jgi:hypothetical protein
VRQRWISAMGRSVTFAALCWRDIFMIGGALGLPVMERSVLLSGNGRIATAGAPCTGHGHAAMGSENKS